MPETRYPALLRAFYASPWAILPAKLWALREFLHFAAAGGKLSEAEVEAVSRRAGPVTMAGRVAVLPLFGVLAQRMGMLEESSGGTSTEGFGAALDAAVADKGCKAVCIVADSPGGSVYGVEELARKVYQARGEKKIVCAIDSLAASAAYWVAAQCSEVNITHGGQCGSIGAFSAHEDLSGAMEAEGVKVTLVSAGKYKVEGNPYGPLDDDARAAMQEQVNGYYGQFVGAVARGRGVSEAAVRNGYGQGRLVGAKDAVAAGMADRVATLEQVLTRLGAPGAPDGAGARLVVPGVDALRRRLELEALDLPGPVAFVHNSKTADSEPSWGDVDKAALPRIAFADKGEPDKKSTWGYPHHWVQGGKSKDDNGVLTDGTLFLHRGGLNAAWSAAHGGRSGDKAPAAVIAHLAAHRKALGLDED